MSSFSWNGGSWNWKRLRFLCDFVWGFSAQNHNQPKETTTKPLEAVWSRVEQKVDLGEQAECHIFNTRPWQLLFHTLQACHYEQVYRPDKPAVCVQWVSKVRLWLVPQSGFRSNVGNNRIVLQRNWNPCPFVCRGCKFTGVPPHLQTCISAGVENRAQPSTGVVYRNIKNL